MKGLKIVIAILVILAIVFGFYYFLKNSSATEVDVLEKTLSNAGNTIFGLCFCKETSLKNFSTPSTYEMEVYIIGNQVEGSLSIQPENMEAKQGKFYGNLLYVDEVWFVDAWWDSFEGSKNMKEELKVILKDNTAQIGMGPMNDNGDGTYFYKNKAKLSYDLKLGLVDCR